MSWANTPYVVPVLFSAAVSASLALFAWGRRAAVPCATAFALFAAACAAYALGYTLEVVAATLLAKVLWAKLEWVAIASLAPLYLVFTLQYAGYGHLLTWRVLGLLAVPCAAVVLLALTNEAHGLLWSRLSLERVGPLLLLVPERGPAFWAFSAFAYGLILLGAGALSLTALHGRGLYRHQGLLLLAGMLVPMFGNLSYAVDLSLVPYLNPTPITFTFSVGLYAYAIFRFRFLELGPVARQVLVERMRDGVLVVDAHGYVADLNPALEAALSLRAADVIGRPAAEVVAAWPHLAKLLASGSEVEGETALGEGRTRREYAFSIGSLVAGGQPGGLLLALRDITELKRLEAQFVQAQKMETVGRLAGGVAHDFNNLLTAITGHASFARDALPPDHPARGDVERVLKSTRRAAQLTQQLLAFSRHQGVALRTTNLNDLVLDMAEMLGHLTGEGVALVIEPAPDLGAVQVDANQLEQALINLALNARDAMPGGGTLAIRTANVTVNEECPEHPGVPPGRYVALAVSDTGTGLDEEVRAHLFEPFFTTKEVGKGTGLGLASVFGIVRQHQGYIVAGGEPGQGATFTIYLPVTAEPAQEEEKAVPEPPLVLPRGHERVLVVEDDPDVRAWAAQALGELGYEVLQAGNGPEALSLIERQPHLRPDLLVTDVVMPQMTGRALADRLQAAYPGMQVLLVSGYTSGTVAATDQAAGRAFLEKPFSQATLACAVRDLLDGTI